WADYVELSPASRIVCNYVLPSGVGASGVTSLSLDVNYRGPSKDSMTWTFEALDTTTGTWVLLGDNAFATGWVWTKTTFTLPGPMARFFSSGTLQIRYGTTSSADASDLDQLIVTGTSGGSGGSTGAGGGGGSGGSSGSAAVSTNASSYTTGATVTVSYSGLPGNARDWIAIAPSGSANTTYVAWVYTNGQVSGSATFTAPAAGTYVARAFVNDTFTLLAQSATFTTTAAGPTVTTNQSSYAV